jgi:hypothetical protein
MIRRFFLTVAVAASFASVGWSQWQLEAVLNGANETPPVPTAATGFASVTLNLPSNSLSYHVRVTGLLGAKAHIHTGAVGVPGPPIITLTGGPTVYEGVSAPLTTADVITLLTEGMYVNVHTPAFPGGEVRGQLIPVARTYLTANLDGGQETPPVATAATGFARVRLNEPERRLIYDVRATGLVGTTVAHIHTGAAGVPGPPIITLSGSLALGHWCGISPELTAAEVTALKTSGMYINVHTVANPLGEIRGQLIQSVARFSVAMNGAEETPPNASTVTGCGQLSFNPATSTLSYSITCGALPSGFLSAHIHTGVLGFPGPITVPLVGGPTSFSGSAVIPAATVTNLFKGNLYVNIHSLAFVGGEIRGQVRPDPYVFGYGGDGTSGKPRIDAALYDPPTVPFVVFSLTNAFPGAAVTMFVGGGTTFSTLLGSPLPVVIPPVGPLWVDIDPGFAFPLVADATGCAEIFIPVPAIPCVKGYLQCISVDPVNFVGLVLSDALEFTLL